MAVTIHQIPATHSPSDNPLRYTFSSNQTGQPNFSYIVRTYIGGILVSTDRVFPTNGARAFFDASKVAKYNVNTPILPTLIYQSTELVKSIYITVTEEYGVTPEEESSTTSTTTYTWKACLSDKDFLTTNFNNWVGTKYLTKHPSSSIPIATTEQDVPLSVLNDGSFTQHVIRAFNSVGSQLGVSAIYNVTEMSYTFNLKRSLVSIQTGANEADIAFVTVSGTGFTTYRVNYYEQECGTPSVLMWLNDLGAYDWFIFEHNRKESAEIRTFGFEKKFGGWSGNEYVYDGINSGNQNFTTLQIDKGVIYTNYISQTLQGFLTEAYKSPTHYLYYGNSGAQLIEVTKKSFEKYQDRFEELYSEEVTYNVSSQNRGLTI